MLLPGNVLPQGAAGSALPGSAEVVGLAAVVVLRLTLSVVALSLPRVSLVFLSRRLEPTRAQRWLDPLSPERLSLSLLRALSLAALVGWAVSLAARAGAPRPGLVGFAAAAVLVVLVGEGLLVPLLARLAGERFFGFALPALRTAGLLLAPIAVPVSRLVAVRVAEGNGESAAVDEEEMEEELQAFIDVGEARGILEGEEGELVEQIVAFGDTVVREVMTPRTEMITLTEDAGVEEARRLFVESRHSRLPVYRGTLDDIVGILNVRDLLEAYPSGATERTVATLMRPVLHVPETRKVARLLRFLQRERAPMAIVVDEYGGTAGLVTIEDLLEEIVGEIKDEHEVEEEIVAAPGGGWVVDGLCSVEDLGEVVGRELRREGVDSVGGLVFSTLGRLPDVGETLRVGDLEIEVLELDQRRIARLHVRPVAAGSDAETP